MLLCFMFRMEEGDFISFGEAELMVEGLNLTKLEKIGSRDWKKQHEYLTKLNQQAQLNAQDGTTEFISELCSRKKIMKILVYELLSFELWRHKVIPIIIKTKNFNPQSTLPLYTSLYHETVIGKSLISLCPLTDFQLIYWKPFYFLVMLVRHWKTMLLISLTTVTELYHFFYPFNQKIIKMNGNKLQRVFLTDSLLQH